MRKFYYGAVTTCLLCLNMAVSAQKSFFSTVDENQISITPQNKRVIIPQKFASTKMEVNAMKQFLWQLPSEPVLNLTQISMPILSLPMPDGSFQRFRVWESSLMEAPLQAKFPEMKTFAGQGIDDPHATIRMDYNPYFGFHAQVLSPNGVTYIDPYMRGNTEFYISYNKQDHVRYAPFVCETENNFLTGPTAPTAGPCRGTQLYTYRLALACTGEYAIAVCAPAAPTVAATAAAMLTTVTRVTGVYEKEVALRMVLVANNDLLIYLNPSTDPYTNNNGGTMLGQNQTNIDNVIGSANYDIGHVVSTGGGGVASLRVPCTSSKARGVTGLPNPVGDPFDIDYVAHEMGHQWGGNHTFNSTTSNCGGGNRNAGTAYEVGSGTSIQAYAGICGADNIQPNSDPHFHAVSYDEISNFIETGNGNNCKVATATGNILPVITSVTGTGNNIPLNTPFMLSASATDANNDALTYCWEEWDLGTGGAWNNGANNATSPLFKSRVPKISGSRSFPDINVILANYPANPAATLGGLKGETLPAVARTMKFRVTVRDNRAGGGGIVSAGSGCQLTGLLEVNAITSTGPFVVTVPNGGETYPANSTQTVTWNVAGTNLAPINTADVKLTLSTDGGFTYPTVLAASVPNSGSAVVTMPNLPTTQARVRVEAINNIYFDISNANFTITVPVSGFSFNASTPATVACAGPNTASVSLGTTSNGGFTTPIVLTANGNPVGTTVSFSTNPLTPGNSTNVILTGTSTLAAGTYTINVNGMAGAISQSTTVSYIVTAGAAPVITTPPASQTVCVGANASFSVTATGVTNYQWQLSTDAGVTYSNIAGATTSNYSITGVTLAMNNNRYRVMLTSQCGSVSSAAAILTVNTAPSISGQPQNASVCTGNNAVFSVTAAGTSLTYQWQLSTDNGGSWANITGQTASTLTLTAVTLAMNNYQYRVLVSGTCTPVATSVPAILTVGNAPTITGQPTNSTVCSGTNTSFTVTASGSSLTYQWQLSTDAGITFNNIAGQTAPTLSLAAVSTSMNGYQYRVNVASCLPTPVTSNAATLTVNTPVSVAAQPVATAVCSGTAASFSVTASGTGINYQWQSSPAGCAGTFTNIPGATAAVYNTGSTTAGMNGTGYRVVVTGTCNTITSSCVALTVNSPITIAAQPQNAAVCLPGTTSFSITAAGTGIVYQWEVSTNGGTSFTNIAGANTATYNPGTLTAAMNGNQYRVVLSGTCTTTLNSTAATLTVNLPVNITAEPLNTAVCEGLSTSFTVVATGSTISYQWQSSFNGGAFINLANGAPYSGTSTATLGIANTSHNLDGMRYRVIVSGVPCGAVNSNTVTLTVNKLPVPVLTLASYNSINPYLHTRLYTTVSPPGDYRYDWYRNGNLVSSITGAGVDVTVDELGEYQVTVTDRNTGCSSQTSKVTVTASASGVVFIYPNPSSGNFVVRYYNAQNTSRIYMVNIYDSKGARVYTRSYSSTRAYDRMDVNLPQASSGVYLVEVKDADGNKLATSKLVIKK